MDLIPKEIGKAGRKQTVSARAWISREERGSNFMSNVSLGKGRAYKLNTETRNRSKALDFNRAHLLKLLLARPSEKSKSQSDHQLLLLSDPAA